jgi:integrase/recombinase XerD
LNPSYKLGKQFPTGEKPHIMKEDLNKYIARRTIEDISDSWLYQCQLWLNNYLNYTDWRIDEEKTLEYCKILKEKHPITYFRKKVYQIRRFLEYLKVDWASSIKLPPEPLYYPKKIDYNDIEETISNFKNHKYFKQIKAIILLGISSGMRPEEMYQLTQKDIDITNRIIHIYHDPENGKTTKTKRNRIAIFNYEAQKALKDYLDYFNNQSDLKSLFSLSHTIRLFSNSKVKVKDLRKFFSQEWDRRSGPTSIKKILMGHSMKGDVDLMHYNYQSEEDLKKIYDRVMNEAIE